MGLNIKINDSTEGWSVDVKVKYLPIEISVEDRRNRSTKFSGIAKDIDLSVTFTIDDYAKMLGKAVSDLTEKEILKFSRGKFEDEEVEKYVNENLDQYLDELTEEFHRYYDDYECLKDDSIEWDDPSDVEEFKEMVAKQEQDEINFQNWEYERSRI